MSYGVDGTSPSHSDINHSVIYFALNIFLQTTATMEVQKRHV